MVKFRQITLLLSLIALNLPIVAQTLHVSGEIYDSLNFRPVREALITLAHHPDSLNSRCMKTDYRGRFELETTNAKNLKIWISHPLYSDTNFMIFNTIESNHLQLGRIILSENTKTFSDIEIVAVLPVSFKGDTVVFAADSFVTRPNAKVEDLLKNLPGVEINAEGQFVVNGKIVEKLLLDGEEFLSSDFTSTTKNINAKIIQSVQVYEAPPDNRSNVENTEKQQVINLKLKPEAKNSVSSDITLGSDFHRFYDNHLFTTRFKDKRKIALQAKNFNTENSDNMRNNRGKIEFSFQDQLTKKLYLNAKYNLDFLKGTSDEDLFKQYLFTDSSSCIQEQNSRLNYNLNNGFTTEFTYKPDTLTNLKLKTEFIHSKQQRERMVSGMLYDDNFDLFGDSWLNSIENGLKKELIHETDFTRKFNKDRRNLSISQRSNVGSDDLTNLLIIENNNDFNPDDSVRINQNKTKTHNNFGHVLHARYTEPLKQFWSLEFNYFLQHEQSNREIASYNRDANGLYSIFDTLFSNNFKNRSTTNQGGVQLRYKKDNHDFSIKTQFVNIKLYNLNLSTGEVFQRGLQNVQGRIHYQYRIKKEININSNLNSYSRVPTVVQFQPIPDNSNPNQIYLGNPDLKPSIHNEFRFNFSKWNPTKFSNFNARVFGNLVLNDISTSTNFNSSGQNEVKFINISQSIRTGYSTNFGFPLVKDRLIMRVEHGTNFSVKQNVINGDVNEASALNQSGTLSFKYDNKSNLDSELVFRSTYSQTKNSLSTFTKPSFWSFKLDYEIKLKLPQKFELSSQVNGYYLTNTRIANSNYLIWNAQIKRRFLKEEQLTCALSIRDILDQTTSISRTISANVIIDSNAEMIARYFLISMTYNLQKNIKARETEN